VTYRFAGEASSLARECSLEEIVHECCVRGGLATAPTTAPAVCCSAWGTGRGCCSTGCKRTDAPGHCEKKGIEHVSVIATTGLLFGRGRGEISEVFFYGWRIGLADSQSSGGFWEGAGEGRLAASRSSCSSSSTILFNK